MKKLLLLSILIEETKRLEKSLDSIRIEKAKTIEQLNRLQKDK